MLSTITIIVVFLIAFAASVVFVKYQQTPDVQSFASRLWLAVKEAVAAISIAAVAIGAAIMHLFHSGSTP